MRTHTILLILIPSFFAYHAAYGSTRQAIRDENKIASYSIRLTEHPAFKRIYENILHEFGAQSTTEQDAELGESYMKKAATDFLKSHFLAHDETALTADWCIPGSGEASAVAHKKKVLGIIDGTNWEASTILHKNFLPYIQTSLSMIDKHTIGLIYTYLMPSDTWLTALEDLWIHYATSPYNQDMVIKRLLCIKGKYTIDNLTNTATKSAHITEEELHLCQDGRGSGHHVMKAFTEKTNTDFYNQCIASWMKSDRFSDTIKITQDRLIDLSSYFPYMVQHATGQQIYVAFDPMQKINTLEKNYTKVSSELESLKSVYQRLINTGQPDTKPKLLTTSKPKKKKSEKYLTQIKQLRDELAAAKAKIAENQKPKYEQFECSEAFMSMSNHR